MNPSVLVPLEEGTVFSTFRSTIFALFHLSVLTTGSFQSLDAIRDYTMESWSTSHDDKIKGLSNSRGFHANNCAAALLGIRQIIIFQITVHSTHNNM